MEQWFNLRRIPASKVLGSSARGKRRPALVEDPNVIDLMFRTEYRRHAGARILDRVDHLLLRSPIIFIPSAQHLTSTTPRDDRTEAGARSCITEPVSRRVVAKCFSLGTLSL